MMQVRAVLLAVVLAVPVMTAAATNTSDEPSPIELADVPMETPPPRDEAVSFDLGDRLSQLNASQRRALVQLLAELADPEARPATACQPGDGCFINMPFVVDESGDTMVGDLAMQANIIMTPTEGNDDIVETAALGAPVNQLIFEGGTGGLVMPNAVFRIQEGGRLIIENETDLVLPADINILFSGGQAKIGTLDADNFRLVVRNNTGLRIQNAATPSVIGGNENNTVSTSVVGAAIGGGGTGVAPNEVGSHFGTVGGGINNVVGGPGISTSGIGLQSADAYAATVGGGANNTASGVASTVPGGESNEASGDYSFAAGRTAEARHSGSFVWNGVTSGAGFGSQGAGQFLINAPGNVGIDTNTPSEKLTVDGNIAPAVNDAYDLGSPTNRWNKLWMASEIDYANPLLFQSGGATRMTLDTGGNLTVGALIADILVGDGSGLTGVQASDVADGSITPAKLADVCATDEVLKYSGTAWTCAEDVDTDTTYTAGSGLALAGTEFSADTGVVQARVAGECPAGESIRTINADGTVVCEVDDDTTYGAASNGGLQLDGNDLFAIEFCNATGEIMVFTAGTGWACGADQDTTYKAGTGLVLSGTEFSSTLGTDVDSSEIVDGTIALADLGQNGCSGGEVLKWTASSNAWACAADTDTDTTYTAGTDLTLVGTEFNVDSAVTRDSEVMSIVTNNDGAGSGLDADLLDGVSSAAFLRADNSDSFTGTTLTIGASSTLDVDGTLQVTDLGSSLVPDTNDTYALGSSDKRFTDLYLASVIHHAGDGLQVKNGAGDVTLNVTRFGDMKAGNAVIASGDVYVGNGAGDDDDRLYFDSALETLMWDDSANTFALSNDISVTGGVAATSFSGDGSDLTGVTADNADNANTLDGFDSSQFLRSDAPDTFSGELLTLEKTLRVGNDGLQHPTVQFGPAGAESIAWDSSASEFVVSDDISVGGGVAATSFSGDGSDLTGVTADNANTLDGFDSSQFLRSDAPDTFSGELLTLEKTLRVGNDGLQDPTVQFGPAGAESIAWDSSASEFVVSDDLDVTGALSASSVTSAGGVSGTSGAFTWINLTDLVASGTVSATTLSSTGDTRVGGDLSVVGGSASDDDTIFFDSGTTEFLRWDDSQGHFELSDDLAMSGALHAGSISSTAAYSTFGSGTPESGLINSINDVYVAGDIEQGGRFFSGGDRIRLNWGTTDLDGWLMFEDTTTLSDPYLRWDHADDMFWFNNDLTVVGDLRLDGPGSNDDDFLFFDTADHLMWDDSANWFRFSNDLRVTGSYSQSGPRVSFGSAEYLEDGGAFTVSTGGNSLEVPNGGVCIDDDGNCVPPTAGHIKAFVYDAAGHSDVAEVYPSKDVLVPGDLVVFDPSNPGGVRRATSAYEAGLVSVVSSAPGVLLGAPTDEELEQAGLLDGLDEELGQRLQPTFGETVVLPGTYPIALSGRVPVKATTVNGPIHAGDPLTSSDVPGTAMLATEPGPIVGYALEDLEFGTGEIQVFIQPDRLSGPATDPAIAEELDLLKQENEDLKDQLAQLSTTLESVLERLDRLEQEHASS